VATKIYTTNGTFEVEQNLSDIITVLNAIKEPPFMYQGKINDEDRVVIIMAQEIVALEETY
jgi:hypothetical protein